MLSPLMPGTKCKICGGEDAPIINGIHLEEIFCNKQRAKDLLFNLLKAHENMIKKPDYFSKDNPTKQSYYGLLNKTLELIEKALNND